MSSWTSWRSNEAYLFPNKSFLDLFSLVMSSTPRPRCVNSQLVRQLELLVVYVLFAIVLYHLQGSYLTLFLSLDRKVPLDSRQGSFPQHFVALPSQLPVTYSTPYPRYTQHYPLHRIKWIAHSLFCQDEKWSIRRIASSSLWTTDNVTVASEVHVKGLCVKRMLTCLYLG